MPPSRSQLIATANAFVAAYNKWTVPDVLSIRSPTCKHHLLPGTKLPSRNNQEFAEFLERIIPIIRNFRLHVVDTTPPVVDVEARKVMMHLKSSAETDVGPYENEYFFVLTVSEDGEKIDEVVEFLDTAYTAEFMERLSKTGQTLA
ncbi:hypothetical protein BBK36DRAFT_1143884 [Trichoderma citrinoviride]|uniref:SnoaL-like domain-containing protein n=1 Tax=Trichoderma citrinoviride TaxID=58853 RepID=A0A2T4B251_9HYPO|nr:hypothetical protein BBK36DRAFT_1143884 [Trichoderma citrinoviride]PTB63399.1 hypothetical protein BBK36DRAFT_1143884 [Trichoderma citrinoviride]